MGQRLHSSYIKPDICICNVYIQIENENICHTVQSCNNCNIIQMCTKLYYHNAQAISFSIFWSYDDCSTYYNGYCVFFIYFDLNNLVLLLNRSCCQELIHLYALRNELIIHCSVKICELISWFSGWIKFSGFWSPGKSYMQNKIII